MGAIKNKQTANTLGQVVLYRDKDGWFGWSAAHWWDQAMPAQNGIFQREEIGRFDDLIEAMDARDAYNQMLHGSKHPRNY